MISELDRHALFIDIDGTLTADNNIIPQRNIDALNKAKELGHKVLINTGRSYGNIPPSLFDQFDFDGVLSGNGTMISFGDKVVFSNFMSRELTDKIAKYAFDEGNLWIAFEGVRHCYIFTNGMRGMADIQIPVKAYEDYSEFADSDDIQVIAVSKNISRDYLNSLSDEITFFEFDNYYDIVSKGNNKANAMKIAVEILGINPEKTIAFGDSENDLNMLEYAGTAVAMANAQPDVLKAADFVSLSNKDGGVGYATEKLLLNKGVLKCQKQ